MYIRSMNKFVFFASVCISLFLAACGDDSSPAKPSLNESSSSIVKSSSSTTTKKSSSSSSEKNSSSAKSSSSSKASSSSKKVEQSSSSVIKSSSSVKPNIVDPSTVVIGSLTDSRDGQTYKTVTIGTQTWMAENLNYAYLLSTEELDSCSYCYWNKTSNCEKYGRLYMWSAAMDSAGIFSTNGKGCGFETTCSPTYPVRGVCPSGWHLPTTAEFDSLLVAVGGKRDADSKLQSTSGWDDYDGKKRNGTDDYSFSALPAGYSLYGGSFEDYHGENTDAVFWGATEYGGVLASRLKLDHVNGVSLYSYVKVDAYSVRCVKD